MPVPRWMTFRKAKPRENKRIKLDEGEKLHVVCLCLGEGARASFLAHELARHIEELNLQDKIRVYAARFRSGHPRRRAWRKHGGVCLEH